MKQSTHAQETRTLRGRPRKDRQEAGRSLRDLPASDEAQAATKRKVIPMGVHGNIVNLVLQIERDDLISVLWKAEDQQRLWRDETKYSFVYHNKKSYSNARLRHLTAMRDVFDDYIASIKKRLISLDERISPIRHGR